MKTLSIVLKHGRKATGMTQMQVAKMVGLSARETISNYETAKERPSNETLLKLKEIYGLEESFDELLELKMQSDSDLTLEETDLIRAFRSDDANKIMRIVARKIYNQTQPA